MSSRSQKVNARIPHGLGLGLLILSLVCGVFWGCTHEPSAASCGQLLVPIHTESPESLISVPGDCGWIPTHLEVREGDAVTITADGLVRFQEESFCNKDKLCHAGPEGIYLYDDDAAFQRFPLPSAAEGPAPCFCLIGRIGDGPAFFVGRAKSFVAPATGTLWLGINDFNLTDNTGEFTVSISQPEHSQPVALENVVHGETHSGTPVAEHR